MLVDQLRATLNDVQLPLAYWIEVIERENPE